MIGSAAQRTTMFYSPASSPEILEICLSLMTRAKHGIDFICVLAKGCCIYKKSYTTTTKEFCPADLLECPQQTFLRYRLSCFVMGYEEKMASDHHYFNNTVNIACTGMVEIVTEPNFMNEKVASLKKWMSVLNVK